MQMSQGRCATPRHACHAIRTSRVQGPDCTSRVHWPDCGSLPLLWPQRDKVYAERRRALEASDLTPLMVEYAERTIDDILEVRPDFGWAHCQGWMLLWLAVCLLAVHG